jgi:hypothetical protein
VRRARAQDPRAHAMSAAMWAAMCWLLGRASVTGCDGTTNTRPQARANKTSSGDLQKKLDAQRRQTHNQTLQQVATENRAARDADQATEARNYN